MNKTLFLILIFLIQCFTVYNKNEIILESRKIDSKNRKVEKDIFTLTYAIKKEGLTLFLDGYRAEENNQVDFIKETYQVNKTLKNPQPPDRDSENKIKSDNSCKDAMFIVCVFITGPVLYVVQYVTLAVLTPIFLLELPTLPFRLYPEKKERIREEIRKGNVTKIGTASKQEKSLTFINRKPTGEYVFKENKIFIPWEELKFGDPINNNFSFQILDTKTRETLLEGNFDLSEEIFSNKELNSIILKNNISNNSLVCKKEYPFLENKEIGYEDVEKNIKQFCKNKYSEIPSSILHYDKYNDCIKEIKGCYEITRYSE